MARVPYIEPEELDPEYRDLVVSSLQPGKRVNVYSAVGNNPPVLRGLRDYLGALWNDSGLTDRQRELVILTVAAETGNRYEWHQHVNIAEGAGVTREEMTAIAEDDADPFDAGEVALCEYARAVVGNGVTDDVHEAVADRFDDRTVAGAAATAAGYLCLGRVIEALGVEIEAGDEFVGWSVA
ncbi:MAG: carboxymuconolactone decarboxylase family protein [Haloferacaceae archaeon]